jgi:hypothetical protein
MDRAKRWFLLTLASLLSSMGFSQRRRTQAVISRLSYVGDGLTAIVNFSATYRPSTKPARWLVNWGDGHEQEGTGRPPSELSHTYLVSGDFGIRFAIWDSSGGYSETLMPASIRIRNSQAEPPSGGSDDYAFYCQGGYAGSGTVRATTGSQTDVQAKVDAAVDGDIICIPPGTHTSGWSNGLVNDGKNLLFIGAGAGSTVINSSGPYIFYNTLNGATRGDVRISGFTFTGTVGVAVIEFTSGGYSGVPSGRWRVDHNTFDFPNGTVHGQGISVHGVNYGLIDNNTFDPWFPGGYALSYRGGLQSECPGGNSFPPEGAFMLGQAVDHGTDRFMYVEDNSFVEDGAAMTIFDTDFGGARLVYRYNTSTGAFLYSHWTGGCHVQAVVYEVYNNTFIGNAAYGYPGVGYAMRFEAGTGVIYNNYANGFSGGSDVPYVFLDDRRADFLTDPVLFACDGSRAWDGNIEANGWPCLGQPGRATGQTWANIENNTEQQASAPVYLWNNGVDPGCASGGSCTDNWGAVGQPTAYVKATAHSNGDVDYVLNGSTPKPGYSAYTYPHPKRSQTWP